MFLNPHLYLPTNMLLFNIFKNKYMEVQNSNYAWHSSLVYLAESIPKQHVLDLNFNCRPFRVPQIQ